MINRARTGFMPNSKFTQGEAVEQLEPAMVNVMGKDTLCLHVGFAATALVGRNKNGVDQIVQGHGAEITLIVARPGQVGLLHTMSIEQTRAFATSLHDLADKVEDAAAADADAALKKAAGK